MSPSSSRYLVLHGVVRQAGVTIERQQAALRAQVGELSSLLDQNAALHQRVSAAAARTTTLNERYLRRIGADLHDGPAQMLSLALLRMDAGPTSTPGGPAPAADQVVIEGAVRDALREMRAIASGLRLPELESATVAEVAERAIADHRRRTGAQVEADLDEVRASVSLPVRIALFRALQELLSNATRHGSGVVTVRLGPEAMLLRLDVSRRRSRFRPGQRGWHRSPRRDRTPWVWPASASRRSCWVAGSRSPGTPRQDVVSVWWPSAAVAGRPGARPDGA